MDVPYRHKNYHRKRRSQTYDARHFSKPRAMSIIAWNLFCNGCMDSCRKVKKISTSFRGQPLLNLIVHTHARGCGDFIVRASTISFENSGKLRHYICVQSAKYASLQNAWTKRGVYMSRRFMEESTEESDVSMGSISFSPSDSKSLVGPTAAFFLALLCMCLPSQIGVQGLWDIQNSYKTNDCTAARIFATAGQQDQACSSQWFLGWRFRQRGKRREREQQIRSHETRAVCCIPGLQACDFDSIKSFECIF
jgi:hypothetical protein